MNKEIEKLKEEARKEYISQFHKGFYEQKKLHAEGKTFIPEYRFREWQRKIDKQIDFLDNLIDKVRQSTLQEVWDELDKVEKLDHHCKCEGKHLISIEREDYDKIKAILKSKMK